MILAVLGEPIGRFIDEPIYHHGSPLLRVGTDCSGIEAPIQALGQLGIPFKHVFSSEIEKCCIQSIKANYHSEILFGDPDGPYPEGDITKIIFYCNYKWQEESM